MTPHGLAFAFLLFGIGGGMLMPKAHKVIVRTINTCS